MAAQTPASRIPSHGTDMLGQRYAFDFIRFDPRPGARDRPVGGVRGLLFGIPTRQAHGWGEPIHAPLDGEVVAAVDGVPERARLHVVRELLLVLRNGVLFRPTPSGCAGSSATTSCFATATSTPVFAHLTTGSVAVREGDAVRTADVLGRVGHTGNSTAPHLHFQLMDGPDPLVAKGVPCAFRAYEVEDGDTWRLVEEGIPRANQRVRWAAVDRPG